MKCEWLKNESNYFVTCKIFQLILQPQLILQSLTTRISLCNTSFIYAIIFIFIYIDIFLWNKQIKPKKIAKLNIKKPKNKPIIIMMMVTIIIVISILVILISLYWMKNDWYAILYIYIYIYYIYKCIYMWIYASQGSAKNSWLKLLRSSWETIESYSQVGRIHNCQL